MANPIIPSAGSSCFVSKPTYSFFKGFIILLDGNVGLWLWDDGDIIQDYYDHDYYWTQYRDWYVE